MIPGSCRQQYWLKFIMKRTLLMTAPKSLLVFGQDITARKCSLATRTVGGGQAVPNAVSQCLSYACLGVCSFMEPRRPFHHMSWQQLSSWICGISGAVSETFTRCGIPLCHAVLRHACCAVLCCAVLCCAVLCCAVLCCAVSLWTIRSSLHCAGIAARCATVTMMGHLSELFGGVWCNVIEIFASHVHTCPPRNCSCAHLYHHSCCTSEHLDRFAGNTSEA